MGITEILAFFLKNKSFIVVGIILAIVASEVLYIKILRSEEATLVAEKTILNNKVIDLQANVAQLKNDLEFQNKEVERFKNAADERAKQHVIELKAAQDTAAKYKKQAADLLKRQPQQNANKCDNANQLITEELRNAK